MLGGLGVFAGLWLVARAQAAEASRVLTLTQPPEYAALVGNEDDAVEVKELKQRPPQIARTRQLSDDEVEEEAQADVNVDRQVGELSNRSHRGGRDQTKRSRGACANMSANMNTRSTARRG